MHLPSRSEVAAEAAEMRAGLRDARGDLARALGEGDVYRAAATILAMDMAGLEPETRVRAAGAFFRSSMSPP